MIKFGRIFLIVFIFGLLIIPLFHMNTAEITEQENRTLARFPEVRKKSKPNYEFGKEFESWLGDRFWGRDQLIDTRFQTMYKINGRIENDKAFVGDDGWMFGKWGTANYYSLEKQREKIEKDADILKRFDDKFKGKNIPIYLVLIPNRNQLYQKYWEKYYTPKPRLDYNEELIESLKDHPNIHIIYPKKEFIEAMKTDDLFYKTDLHMTTYAKKIIMKNLLEKIKIYEKIDIDFDFELELGKHEFKGIAQKLNIKSNEYTPTIVQNIIHSIKFPMDVIKSGAYTDKTWPSLEIIGNKKAVLKRNTFVFGECSMTGFNKLISPIYAENYYMRITNPRELLLNLKEYFLPKVDQEPRIIFSGVRSLKELNSILERIK